MGRGVLLTGDEFKEKAVRYGGIQGRDIAFAKGAGYDKIDDCNDKGVSSRKLDHVYSLSTAEKRGSDEIASVLLGTLALDNSIIPAPRERSSYV